MSTRVSIRYAVDSVGIASAMPVPEASSNALDPSLVGSVYSFKSENSDSEFSGKKSEISGVRRHDGGSVATRRQGD